MATSERPLSMEQHKHVEAGVEADVRSFIQKRYPGVSEVFCQQLYTEDVDPGLEMIAHFRCQAVGAKNTDNASEQVFEGYLRLYSNDGFATWGETAAKSMPKRSTFSTALRSHPAILQIRKLSDARESNCDFALY